MNLLDKVYIAKYAYTEDKDRARSELSQILLIDDLYFLYIPETDTESYIVKHNGNDCLIALAGTGSLRDFRYDIFFWPKKYKQGYVHSGFLKIINNLKQELNVGLLRMFPDGINHLDIIGHSLGAAEACLVIDEVYRPYKSHNVTCFGCPNGFSYDAQWYLNRYNIHQVINTGDYVTKLLGVTSGKPYLKKTRLKGALGHSIDKYIQNIKNMKESR